MSENTKRLWRTVWTTFVATEIPVLIVVLESGKPIDWHVLVLPAIATFLKAILKTIQFVEETKNG